MAGELRRGAKLAEELAEDAARRGERVARTTVRRGAGEAIDADSLRRSVDIPDRRPRVEAPEGRPRAGSPDVAAPRTPSPAEIAAREAAAAEQRVVAQRAARVDTLTRRTDTKLEEALETGELPSGTIRDAEQLVDNVRAQGRVSTHPTARSYETAGETLDAIRRGEDIRPEVLDALPGRIQAEAAARRVEIQAAEEADRAAVAAANREQAALSAPAAEPAPVATAAFEEAADAGAPYARSTIGFGADISNSSARRVPGVDADGSGRLLDDAQPQLADAVAADRSIGTTASDANVAPPVGDSVVSPSAILGGDDTTMGILDRFKRGGGNSTADDVAVGASDSLEGAGPRFLNNGADEAAAAAPRARQSIDRSLANIDLVRTQRMTTPDQARTVKHALGDLEDNLDEAGRLRADAPERMTDSEVLDGIRDGADIRPADFIRMRDRVGSEADAVIAATRRAAADTAETGATRGTERPARGGGLFSGNTGKGILGAVGATALAGTVNFGSYAGGMAFHDPSTPGGFWNDVYQNVDPVFMGGNRTIAEMDERTKMQNGDYYEQTRALLEADPTGAALPGGQPRLRAYRELETERNQQISALRDQEGIERERGLQAQRQGAILNDLPDTGGSASVPQAPSATAPDASEAQGQPITAIEARARAQFAGSVSGGNAAGLTSNFMNIVRSAAGSDGILSREEAMQLASPASAGGKGNQVADLLRQSDIPQNQWASVTERIIGFDVIPGN